MSIIGEILARLKSETGATFRIVGGAGDLAQVKDVPLALPAAYVFVKQEDSEPNARATGPSLQITALDVGIVIVTANIADARGAAAAADIESLKMAVRDALVGWHPASAASAVENVGGQMVKTSGGTVWWEHTVSTTFYVREKQ